MRNNKDLSTLYLKSRESHSRYNFKLFSYQQNELNLNAKKNSLTEKIEKVKKLDTNIVDSLKTDELDNELDQILERNDVSQNPCKN